jgi:hypothetical protein
MLNDKFIRKFACCLATTLLFSACVSAQKRTVIQGDFDNVRIDLGDKKNSYGPCEPTICINPADPMQIAAGAILNRYYWSEDGGISWQSGKLKSSHGVFGDPVIIADWSGNFYFAHLSDPEQKGWSSPTLLDRIVVQKSTDGGKSYDDGSFTGLRHPKDQDKHWLVADPKTGHLLCTWTEFDLYGSHDLANDHSRILFSKSTDGGASWTEAVAINQYEGDCEDSDNTTEGAVPAFGPNGDIYVCWAWNEKIWFNRSLDGGKTWLEKDIVAADQPGGWDISIPGIQRCNGMPVLVCDLSDGPHKGTLYLNWSDQRRGEQDTDIWLAKSTDGGTTWSKPLRVNNDRKGRHQFLSWLAVDQATGYLYIAFYDRRSYADERTDVFLAVSRDGGTSFENIKISKEPFDPTSFVFFGDYNHISAHAGIIRPIWTRMDKGILSIWTAIINEPIKKSQ